MCIGKKFQSNNASIAFSAIITAISRTPRAPFAEIQMPMENRNSSVLETLNNDTTSVLVGAPMAKSSLTA
jgi:hypothetical protein